MRREGRLHLARRICHCCCGTAHRLPAPCHESHSQGSETGAVGDCGCSKLPGCCGHSPQGAKRCFGQNYHHIARCGMCKPGRYHRAGGAKALKKVSGRNGEHKRAEWVMTLTEARLAMITPPIDEYNLYSLPRCKSPWQSIQEVPMQSAWKPESTMWAARKPITLSDWFPEVDWDLLPEAISPRWPEANSSSLDRSDWLIVGESRVLRQLQDPCPLGRCAESSGRL